MLMIMIHVILRPFLIASLLLFIMNTQAQKRGGKTPFNVTIGPSIPIGKYAKSDPYERTMGVAGLGEFLQLSLTHQVKKNFGILAQLQYQRNALNTTKTDEHFSADYHIKAGSYVMGPNGLYQTPVPIITPNPYKNWEFEKSSWSVGSFMVGGFAEFPFK